MVTPDGTFGTSAEREVEPVDLRGLPINLILRNRAVLVVGGGRIGTRKVGSFLDVGAEVHVVAPDISEELRAKVAANAVSWTQREFREADVISVFFVCSATGDPAVESAVFAAAERAHTFCNAADVPQACSATLMALHRDGDVIVAVGSNGRSPAVAQRLRDQIRDLFGNRNGEMLDQVAAERAALRSRGLSSESVDWNPVIDRVQSAVAESNES